LSVQLKPFYDLKTTLRFPEFGHEAHGSKRSDVVVSFVEKPSDCGFTRDGCDLIYLHKLSLSESMSTSALSIKTLDGRTICVSGGEYVTSQTVLSVAGEGMPNSLKNDYVVDARTSLLNVTDMEKGCLKVRFDIHFPTKISNQHKQSILSVLTEAAEAY
jgi:DnaJ-class molecular chaperone